MKKELAIVQLEDALTKGDKSKLSTKGVKKVASAAADDKQLTKSLQKMERDLMRSGGRAGYKSGSCLLYTSPSPRDKRQSRMPSSA